MSRNSWIGLVSSVLVVAAALGVLSLLEGTESRALELPAEVSGLVAVDLVEQLWDGLD